MHFKYYNNNPLGRHVSDCAVRAIALATCRSWDETYQELSNYARHEGITFSEVEFINEYLCEQYDRIWTDSDIITVGDFLKMKLEGTYLITMRGHITCVIDGVDYDTFDPSDRYIHSIYRTK